MPHHKVHILCAHKQNVRDKQMQKKDRTQMKSSEFSWELRLGTSADVDETIRQLSDDLDEQERRHARGDRQRYPVVVDCHQTPCQHTAVITTAALALEMRNNRKQGAAEGQIHEHQVEKEGKDQEHVKQPRWSRHAGCW